MINKGEVADLLISAGLQMQIGSPALPVYQQSVVSTPADDAQYLAVEFVPNDTQNLYVGDDDPSWHQGFLQVTVVGVAGEGVVKLYDLASLVIEAWKKGTVLQGTGFKIRIPRQPTDRGPIKDGKNWRVPVLIPYQTIAR